MAALGTGQDVICVLGMHRSGTSCLMGLLEDAGVAVGPVHEELRETGTVVSINENVLRANGGSWAGPPATQDWPRRERLRRDAFIRGFEGLACWGFKDPRTLWTLEGWLDALPHLQLVGTLRHPSLVARSLHARNPKRWSPEASLELWRVYNERLLALHQRHGFPLVVYDDEAERYLTAVRRALSCLKGPNADAELHFFREEKRHWHGDDPLTPAVRGLYRRLLERSVGPTWRSP